MSELYNNCAKRMKWIASLTQVAGLVNWDQETMMPGLGVKARADQSEALAAVIHEKFTDPALGEMLSLLSADTTLTDDQRVCVREWLRDYEKSTRLPEELVRELAGTTSLAQNVWVDARKKSDFALFAPWLEKIVALKLKQAEAYGYQGVAYDALLDDYEPQMTVAKLDPVMENLREGLVSIVAAIRDSRASVDTKIFAKRYPEEGQERIARQVMAAIGINLRSSRLDCSAHPFCTGLAPTDVRITTRYNEHWLPASLYGVIHESGHALYEQGFDEKYFNTPLAEAVSLGIHESQSRLWENMVGRSRPFVEFLLPRLKKEFGRQLKGVGVEAFYKAINCVETSPIRVEADEVTYNLHVVLRYEIEKGIMAGDIAVRDLPSVWNEYMEKYLDIRPRNDAEGVLQDVHWSGGLVGYFPTYALGNLYAAQWWHFIHKNMRGVDALISKGKFEPVLSWLRKNVHRQGRRFSSSDLVMEITGEPLNTKYFIEYLKKKFGEIYSLRW